jgi:sortase A
MSVQLLLEECCAGPRKGWRLSRLLLLLVGVVALGYSGWIYFDEYWHERRESEAFDEARRARVREIPPQTPPQTPPTASPSQPAEPFTTARLTIPRLRLTAMVEEGVGESTLRRAAGHIPDTALPGRPGNVCVAAHRDTLFRGLKGIKEHDRIVLSTMTGDFEYEVSSTSIVNPEDVGVLAPSQGQKTLTLITCYPFYFMGHAPKRFIVRARQIEGDALNAGG